MTRNTHITKAILTAALAAALAAPAAQADPPQGHRIDDGVTSGLVRSEPDGYQPQYVSDVVDRYVQNVLNSRARAGTTVAATSQPSGFDWGDGLIGLATGVALAFLLAVGAQLGRGRMRPAHS